MIRRTAAKAEVEHPLQKVRPHRGRPLKFARPSRSVTLTLPVDVIEALAAIDPDVSRAIVRLAQPELTKTPHPPAELTTFGRRAVIVINPSRTLELRTGIDLVPLPDGRALISFDHPMTNDAFELLIADSLEDVHLRAADRAIFTGIADIMRTARRSSHVALRQRQIIVLEGRRRSTKTPQGRRERVRARRT